MRTKYDVIKKMNDDGFSIYRLNDNGDIEFYRNGEFWAFDENKRRLYQTAIKGSMNSEQVIVTALRMDETNNASNSELRLLPFFAQLVYAKLYLKPLIGEPFYIKNYIPETQERYWLSDALCIDSPERLSALNTQSKGELIKNAFKTKLTVNSKEREAILIAYELIQQLSYGEVKKLVDNSNLHYYQSREIPISLEWFVTQNQKELSVIYEIRKRIQREAEYNVVISEK